LVFEVYEWSKFIWILVFIFYLLIGFNFFSFFLLDIYDYSFSFVEINVGFYGFWFCNCISGAGWILASKFFLVLNWV